MATIERPRPHQKQLDYEDSWVEDALRVANEARRLIGLPPAERLEKGYRGCPDECPVARTVRKGASVFWRPRVGYGILAVERLDNSPLGRPEVLMSGPAKLFLKAFDECTLFDEYAL